jgi:hypothetical protein
MLRCGTLASTSYHHQRKIRHDLALSHNRDPVIPVEEQELTFACHSMPTALENSNRSLIIKGVDDS